MFYVSPVTYNPSTDSVGLFATRLAHLKAQAHGVPGLADPVRDSSLSQRAFNRVLAQ
jgi:hypothetical protein